MSIMQDFKMVKRALGKVKGNALDEYCQRKNKDLGKIMYVHEEWLEFEKWYTENEGSIYAKKQGVCWKCGEEDLEYGDSDIVDTHVGYEYECNVCGAKGVEWYEMVFVENTGVE